MDKRIGFLVLFLVAILIPYEYITKALPLVRRGFDIVASTELAHIIGHTLLFASLVFLTVLLFDLRLDTRTVLLLGIGVLAVGLGQEYFQLQVKGRGFGRPELFDLGVDLAGASLGWLVSAHLLRYRRYLRIAWFILRNGQMEHHTS